MDTAWSVETSARQELVAKTDDIKRNVFDSQLFSKQEKREFRSVMHVTENKMSEGPIGNKQLQIQVFEKESETYKKKAQAEEDPLRAKTFEDISYLSDAESDILRVEIRQAPQHQAMQDLIGTEAKQNPLTWRDKVMGVLRKMLVVGTVLSILGGGVSLVFTTLSYFHKGTKQAAHAVNEVASAVGKVAKKDL